MPCVSSVSLLQLVSAINSHITMGVVSYPAARPRKRVKPQGDPRQTSVLGSRRRFSCYSDDLKAKGLSWLHKGKFVLSSKFV